MTVAISKKTARRFLLAKQLLWPPFTVMGESAIASVFSALRLIQYDPLNPCGRNTDLVLQARIGDYHPNDYYDWLYTKRRGVEAYDKELCIVPIEDFGLTSPRLTRNSERSDYLAFLQTHQHAIATLLKRIELEGPLTSSAVIEETRVLGGWGTQEKLSSRALEILWKMGRLVIVKREKGKKFYDLPGNVHESLVVEPGFFATLTREHVLRRLQSVGMLPFSGSGGGWQGVGQAIIVHQLLTELVTEGLLLEVVIEETGGHYVAIKDDTNQLKVAPKVSSRAVFLAPLDNLMWDRQMIADLFDFHYRWEVYIPTAKRKFGYYTLPILYGDQFIGRIEPVLTKDNQLLIKGFWQEPGILWTKDIHDGFQQALAGFCRYLRADAVVNNPFPSSVK